MRNCTLLIPPHLQPYLNTSRLPAAAARGLRGRRHRAGGAHRRLERRRARLLQQRDFQRPHVLEPRLDAGRRRLAGAHARLARACGQGVRVCGGVWRYVAVCGCVCSGGVRRDCRAAWSVRSWCTTDAACLQAGARQAHINTLYAALQVHAPVSQQAVEEEFARLQQQAGASS